MLHAAKFVRRRERSGDMRFLESRETNKKVIRSNDRTVHPHSFMNDPLRFHVTTVVQIQEVHYFTY